MMCDDVGLANTAQESFGFFDHGDCFWSLQSARPAIALHTERAERCATQALPTFFSSLSERRYCSLTGTTISAQTRRSFDRRNLRPKFSAQVRRLNPVCEF